MKELIPQYTVSELVENIKNLIEGAFYFVKIIGEISGIKTSTSCHKYFTLKDADSIINIVLFKSSINKNYILEDGLSVIIYGRLTIYKERSSYQIIAENVEINGIGTLLKLIEDRKNRLRAEGLFDVKKPIPKYIKKVGIITAPGGAAIKDIEVRLKDRLLINDIILYPSLVQGQEAENNIILGINYFNSVEIPDVIVITRGGGSFEDLMCFNSEKLARNIFESKVPVITAIGHEIDWTIADYVSDLRLPTPTAVAEFLSPLKSVLDDKLEFLFRKLLKLGYRIFSKFELKIEQLYKNIKLQIGKNFKNKYIRFSNLIPRLEQYNRNKILKQGYAIIKKNNIIITSKTKLLQNDKLQVEIYGRKFNVIFSD